MTDTKKVQNRERMESMNQPQVLVAMKGHPGTGKSTLARAIAADLRCPILDKDDLFGSAASLFHHLPPSTADRLLNDFSYSALSSLASSQLRLGLSLVVDSPLSSRPRLDRLLHIAATDAPEPAAVVIVECRPGDEAEWRRRLERRGEGSEVRWNQAATWADLEGMLERYDGCYEYEAGDVPKMVVDTTAPEEAVASVMAFIRSHSTHPHNP